MSGEIRARKKVPLRRRISKSAIGRGPFYVCLTRVALIIMLFFLFLGCSLRRQGPDDYRVEYVEGLPWWLTILAAIFVSGSLLGLMLLESRY